VICILRVSRGCHRKFPRLLDDFDVRVLPSGQEAVLAGVRFVGATLWTDFQLREQEWQAQAWAAKHMPEYARVRSRTEGSLWPIHVHSEHHLHRQAIESALMRRHNGPTVVVTHHSPSALSIPKGERNLPESAVFASDLELMILRYRPPLWIHGHIHHASDYGIGATRVVCNPRGYVRHDWSEHTGFDELKVVEVSSGV
jgi:hypothetical protein